MSISPISSTRVTLLQRSGLASSTINTVESQITTLGQELATGKAVTQPSDDPAAAVVIQSLTQQIGDANTYTGNITAAQDQLNDADSTLGGLATLLTQATSTAQTSLNSTSTAADRAGAADTIDSIYNQVLATANTTYQGQYLFGGDTAGTAPYVTTDLGVQYNASGGTLSAQTGTFSTLDYQVSGQAVFGGLSASVSTGTDLAPAAAASDQLSNLAGARNNGINLGTIQIGNGTTTKSVDLTGATTLQGVVDDINAAGLAGVTASVSTAGINLAASGGANITVTDPNGTTAAADLGILHATASGANVAVAGANVNAKVTGTTKLSDLLGGTGLDTSGFSITNGKTTVAISLSGLTTVQDLVNTVNTAGIGVRATIRSDGTGIDLSNATQGSSFTVSENGGTTAAELGFTTFKSTTLLSSLNSGSGVDAPTGTQFTINTADGSQVNVGLSGLSATSTVQNVIDQINTAAAGKVTASVSTTGAGIKLTDNTTGSNTLSVTNDNGTSTAADLGLTGGTVSGNTLSGTNVNPVQTPGLLTDLSNLSAALRSNDVGAVSTAAAQLETDSSKIADAEAVVGSRVQELNSQSTSLASQSTSTQSLLSTYQDVNYATAVTQYQTLQTSLQASLEVTAQTLSLSLMNYLR